MGKLSKAKTYSIFDSIRSRRYHSCLITGYSLDLAYLQNVILPTLKTKGVNNISIFVDSGMLERACRNPLCKSLSRFGGCTLSPVRLHGVFHPKVVLFFGEGDGIFSIGSGNPTYGGYGGNWEIWLSAHVADGADPKVQQFARVWKYVSSFMPAKFGIVQQKLEWMEQHSPWLQGDRNNAPDAFCRISDESDFLVLDNFEDGIFEQLQRILPSRKADVINVHSPFYDDNLEVLNALARKYMPAAVNVFLQPHYTCANPEAFSRLKANVRFYDIDASLNGAEITTRRYVHAKLVEFQFEGVAYLLMGSPNLSRSAMGTATRPAINAEVALLLRSRDRHDFFKELGLFATEKNRMLTEQAMGSVVRSTPFADHLTEPVDAVPRYRIVAVDELPSHYAVYVETELLDTVSLRLADAEDNAIEILSKYRLENGEEMMKLDFEKTASSQRIPMFGCLYDRDRKRIISNVLPVNDFVAHTRTNPDRSFRSLQIALHSIESGQNPLWKLFSLLDPEQILEQQEGTQKRLRKSSKQERQTKHSEIEILTSDEMNEMKRLAVEHLRHIQNANALQVIDILNRILRASGPQGEQESADQEEQDDAEDGNSGGRPERETQDDDMSLRHRIGDAEACRRKAIRYFTKYLKILHNRNCRRNPPPNPELAFAVNAITTDLLIYYTTTSFHTNDGLRIGSLIPLRDLETDRDFFWLGLRTVGLFYSTSTRVGIAYESASPSGFSYGPMMKEAARLSALNSLFVNCAAIVISLKLFPDSNYKAAQSLVPEFFNVLDITEQNSTAITIGQATKHFATVFDSSAFDSSLPREPLFRILRFLWESYESVHKVDNFAIPADLTEGILFYSDVFGYTIIDNVSIDTRAEQATFKFSLPGVRWKKEARDVVSISAYRMPPARIFKTNLSLKSLEGFIKDLL